MAALEAGALMRKKWVTRLSAAEAAAAPRTMRHIRCCVQGSRVTLRYHHQALPAGVVQIRAAGVCQPVAGRVIMM